MMVQKALLGTVAGLALLAAQPAVAGDLDYAPEVDISQSSVGQGWYIRGDLGYAGAIDGDKPSYRNVDGLGGYTTTSFDNARFSKPFSYGAGAGYQFNNYLRSDVTVDFFNSSWSGSSESVSRCETGLSVGTSCGFSNTSDYSAIGLLANGYVDLGTFVGFTPYVGAGVGVTQISWDSLNTQGYCVSGSVACNGTTYRSTALGGEDSYRFTYALMAGFAYDLTNRIKFDLGYRYSDVGGGDMFKFGATETALGATGIKGTDEGFTRHEVRAGIRINTW